MPEKLSRSETSRQNGAKSKGPKTPETKAISSKNSIVHGFAAVINVVLACEDKPAFQLHVDSTRAAYKPTDYPEQAFVDQLAAIQWRQSRLVALETALIDAQMGIQNPNFQQTYPEGATDEYFRLVKAWQALSHPPQKPDAENPTPKDPGTPPDGYDISSIELVRRYQVSLDRQFRNTLMNLRQYRKDIASTKVEEPNEPEKPTQNQPQTPKPTPPNPPILLLVPPARPETGPPIRGQAPLESIKTEEAA